MGVSKRQKTRQQKKACWSRKLKRSGKVRAFVGEINDPELMTRDILKKRRTSPHANITLSGKKKRKILKQIKRIQSDKEKVKEIESINKDVVEMADESKVKKRKSKRSTPADVEMDDD